MHASKERTCTRPGESDGLTAALDDVERQRLPQNRKVGWGRMSIHGAW